LELKLQRKDIDLLAPVGSFESLVAAIEGGADSVYFGIGRYNMRARSSVNFTASDLKKIMRICRQFDKKAYLTLNVVFFDDELEALKQTIDLAIENGVHAIIASDQAAIYYAHEKGMPVHLSTQINISNFQSLRFYAEFADVAVLARELNLTRVAEIARQIETGNLKGPSGNLMKIELFAHGALCMSISGKCYLSLHHHNHPANRGECLQDCRRSYSVRDRETGIEMDIENEYILSPKDLCTLPFLNKIIEAGVRVLKIEGRGRSPEYVKVVTESYHQAIQNIVAGNYNSDRISFLLNRVSAVFNRGFWDGYYLGQPLGEWSEGYGSSATQKKSYVARTMNYFAKMGIAEFLCESESLKTGDQVVIIGPTTGVIECKATELRVDLQVAENVKPGERFSMPVPRKVRRADKLYRLSER
jgi:putative protease